MIDCDDLVDDLQRLIPEPVDLAIIEETPPVAAIHINLALFGVEKSRFAEELRDEG